MTKVLVIEDDSFLVDAYSTKLRKAGFETILATNGEEGLEQAHSVKPDVILLDLLLPKLNGFDVLADLKKDKRLKHIPVVVLSNLGQERDIEQVRQLGADEYMIKANVTMKHIIKKIKKLTGHKAKKMSGSKHSKREAAIESHSEFKERTTDKVAKASLHKAKLSKGKHHLDKNKKHAIKVAPAKLNQQTKFKKHKTVEKVAKTVVKPLLATKTKLSAGKLQPQSTKTKLGKMKPAKHKTKLSHADDSPFETLSSQKEAKLKPKTAKTKQLKSKAKKPLVNLKHKIFKFKKH